MNKKKKIIILTATHLLAITIGALIFFIWFLFHWQRILQEANSLYNGSVMLGRYSAYVEVQKSEAKPEDYKNALLGFIETLENVEKLNSKFYDKQIIAHDMAMTYERLARLDSELGNNENIENYKQLAIHNCNISGKKDCSFEKISTISKKLEEMSLWSKMTNKEK